jgi:hypothetical protein
MTDFKWIFVLDGGAARTNQQWLNMRNAVDGKPLTSALVQAANIRNAPQYFIYTDRASNDNRYRLGDVVIHDADQASISSLINTQLTARSLATTGTIDVRAARLLLAELREAGTELGFGAAITNTFNVISIGAGVPEAANADAIAWIAARLANWEVAS